MKAFHIITGLAFFLLGVQSSLAQVGRYDRTRAVGKKGFNYLTEDTRKQKIHNSKDVHIIFSDRDHNKVYAGPYAQRILSEQKLSTPFYAIGEKNGFYKAIAANQSLLGQPKGMFAPLFSSRTHSRDAKKSPFVGWIDKNSVLECNHAFASKDSNFPVCYRAGVSTVSRLSNVRRFFTLDSLNLYDDPFFLDKSKGKLIVGQIMYAHKYDASKQAILASDRPSLSDSTRTTPGWISANLTVMVGQNHVCLLDANYPEFAGLPLGSKLFSTADGNWTNMSTDQKVSVNLPLSAWDRKRAYMLSVKGRDVAVVELDQLIENSKNINVHLVFFDKDRLLVYSLVNAFQGISEKVSKDSQVKFSVISASQKGSRYLSPTIDLGKWIDYPTKMTSPNTTGATGGYGFYDAMNTIFRETPHSKFDNNVFIILGTDELPTFTSDINSEIYSRSAALLLVQIPSKDGIPYQNPILQSKQLLDNNILEYMSFSGDYLCEPKWIKNGSFKDMSIDNENVYLFDAPKNSVITGGSVYPKLYPEFSSAGFLNVLDSLFTQLNVRNSEFINVTRSAENKYSVLRAIPTQEVANLCDSVATSATDIEKNNVNDFLFKKMWSTPQQPSTYDEGYLFDKDEMQDLLDGYRDLMSYISADSPGNQEPAVLRNNPKRQSKLANILSYRKAFSTKPSISKVYHHRTSVLSSDALNHIVHVKGIRRKECNESEWDLAYEEMFKKFANLETRFKSGRLNTIYVVGKGHYFIPLKEPP